MNVIKVSYILQAASNI